MFCRHCRKNMHDSPRELRRRSRGRLLRGPVEKLIPDTRYNRLDLQQSYSAVPEKTSLKALRYAKFAGIITNVRDLTDLTAHFAGLPLPTMFVRRFWNIGFLEIEEVASMATNCDFSRSSLLTEQYQRDMDLIAVALQEESQDERDERLGLVALSWSLTSSCFHSQLEISEAPVYSAMALVRP